MGITFDVYDNMIRLVREGSSIDDIACIMHLDRTYVVNALKQIKTQIITSLDEDKIDVVILIDRLVVKKKYKNVIRDFYGYKSQIFEFLCDGLSNERIMILLGIDYERYLALLKQMYFALITYGNSDEKKYVSLLKNALIEHTIVVREKNKKSISKRNRIESQNDTMKLRGLSGEVVSSNALISQTSDILIMPNTLKYIVISDTHFGSIYENMRYLDTVYEYAAKNGIKYIFHTGDLLEGPYANFRRCKTKYKSIEAQMEHVISDYCYDRDIHNMILLGNHDAFSIVTDHVDVAPLLDERSDFSILGYKSAYIKVRDEYISLKHDISRLINNPEDRIVLVNFYGHSHQYKCTHDDKYSIFRVPTLSDLPDNKLAVVNKGFLVGQIDFNGDIAEYLKVTYHSFDDGSISSFERTLTK